MTDGALYRTKIHCYFLDQTRVIRPLSDEKNYHIFYQMLAGLSHDERGMEPAALVIYRMLRLHTKQYNGLPCRQARVAATEAEVLCASVGKATRCTVLYISEAPYIHQTDTCDQVDLKNSSFFLLF